jgi:hypothetical protein
LKEEYLTNLNLHLPQWARALVELYTSSKKYELHLESTNYKEKIHDFSR